MQQAGSKFEIWWHFLITSFLFTAMRQPFEKVQQTLFSAWVSGKVRIRWSSSYFWFDFHLSPLIAGKSLYRDDVMPCLPVRREWRFSFPAADIFVSFLFSIIYTGKLDFKVRHQTFSSTAIWYRIGKFTLMEFPKSIWHASRLWLEKLPSPSLAPPQSQDVTLADMRYLFSSASKMHKFYGYCHFPFHHWQALMS